MIKIRLGLLSDFDLKYMFLTYLICPEIETNQSVGVSLTYYY